MTHKPKKVGETFMYKESIYDYRGAKLWCETKKVKNPYGSWRYNMYFDVNGDEVRKWGTANTRKYLTWQIDSICQEYGIERAKGFQVYDDEILGEV